MRVWIDIDNAPQARYLLPFVHRFEGAGNEVLLTARESGETFAILRSEGASFEPVGSSFGRGLPRKGYGLTKRTLQLVDLVGRRTRHVRLVLTASRSAALAARVLGMSSFVIIDYEHVNLAAYRLSRSHVVHPSIIDSSFFCERGIRPTHLMPFEGLKEDISFADVDFSSTPAHDFGRNERTAVVLFRPPHEESHYYRSESRELAIELLRHLAAEGVRIVLSPRLPRQVEYLDEVPQFREEPIVLDEPAPFVSLLKGVDAVVSAGGTMLREAAYMGVPAYSIFRSQIGAVDRYLASIGRLSIIASPSDFSHITWTRGHSISPLRERSSVVDAVMKMIMERATSRRRR